ncbi:MAG: pilus assembly protein PilM [Candidatus Pacebacteria bacterium]|nr:pilus assembly protein PilM [Candidatus Paceibacterota bacterium]
MSKNSSSFFGIDLGTTGIRIVELAWDNGRVALRNYVSLEAGKRINPDGTIAKKDIQSLDKDTIESMKTILNTADVAHHKVAMSVPASSTFTSVVSFPRMPKEQLEAAVNYDAPKYIPIPMDEIVFGWSIISNDRNAQDAKGKESAAVNSGSQFGGGDNTRVLLIAIPKEISAKYLAIANAFSLDLVSLETESFSLARSLVGHRPGVYIIIDIGYKMTGITVVDDGSVTESHSISAVGGEELTKVVANSFGVNIERANLLKKESGLNSPSDKKLADILMPILGIIVSEAKKNEQAYLHTNGKKISGVILTGGSSQMPGMQEYMSEEMNLPVEIGNPFQDISYDSLLEEKLRTISSSYAVAVGLALYNFEKRA